MKIEPHELTHPIWVKVADYLAQRIEADRRDLEKSLTGERDSDVLRGQIKAYRQILAKAINADGNTPVFMPERVFMPSGVQPNLNE